jgi:hypothetical protein
MKPELQNPNGSPITVKELLQHAANYSSDFPINQGDTIKLNFPITHSDLPDSEFEIELSIHVDITLEGKPVKFRKK